MLSNIFMVYSFVLIVAVVTFFSTFIGGRAAIKFRKVLQYFFAFSAGSLLAVSFFDLLPESLGLAGSADVPISYLMLTVVAFFFLYSIIERFSLTHHFHEGDNEHKHIMGPIGAIGLIIHSFFDGIAIGSSYQINASIGLIVAFAVIFHDFGDGINTVTLMLKNKYHARDANKFLFMDALAPVLGILATGLFTLSSGILCFILAAFVGEFLYIGAANLLPETYEHDTLRMILSMGLGIILIFFITSVA
jgi:ZIP family zinc transporter